MTDKRSKKADDEISALTAALANHPHGASLEQIIEGARLNVSERTVIRRLSAMVADGTVRKTGASRATRYSLVVSAPAALRLRKSEPPPSQPDLFVPLSKAGGEVMKLISKPLSARKPVAYNRDFLEGYRPNKSAYLSQQEHRRLHEIGRTNTPDEPAGTHAQRVLGRLLIDLSWNSSRLEGNTYSLLDTERLIEEGEAAEGKAPLDAQMILNHKAAIEFLVQSASEIGFNRYTILNLHALLSENLLPDSSASGRIRSIPVTIGGSVYHPPEVPQVLEECFDQILATASQIRDPFEQAFFVMVQLPYLQPFEDVNKRVSRLAANIPFIQGNLSPLSFVDVPDATYTKGVLGVYELNRIELLKDVFLWAYERSAARYAAIRQTLGEPDPFRLKYRSALKELVSDVVNSPMNKKDAARHIAGWAADTISRTDSARFVEVVETELLSLHEGNFARYQIKPSAFAAWKKVWR